MVPRLLGGILGLEARILDRHSLGAPDTLLLHGHSVQVPLISVSGTDRLAQLLAGIVHAAVHAVTLLLSSQVLLPTEKLPRAVNGPVAEISQTSHAERRRGRGEHVLAEGADAVEVLRLGGMVLSAGRHLAGWLLGRGLGGRAGEEACSG